MIGRCTHVVDCREASGMGKGGSLAQRGTFAECGTDVCAVAMSPGRRHITKPVCEITFGLREANVLTSTMVLNAGAGVPHDAPASGGTLFGLTDKEVDQMKNFKLLVIHLGGVANHIISETLKIGYKNKTEVEESMEQIFIVEVAKMTKGLNTIKTITELAPFLGLIGTVIGIWMTFKLYNLIKN